MAMGREMGKEKEAESCGHGSLVLTGKGRCGLYW